MYTIRKKSIFQKIFHLNTCRRIIFNNSKLRRLSLEKFQTLTNRRTIQRSTIHSLTSIHFYRTNSQINHLQVFSRPKVAFPPEKICTEYRVDATEPFHCWPTTDHQSPPTAFYVGLPIQWGTPLRTRDFFQVFRWKIKHGSLSNDRSGPKNCLNASDFFSLYSEFNFLHFIFWFGMGFLL